MNDVITAVSEREPNRQPVPFVDLVAQHEQVGEEVMKAVQRVFADQQFVLGDEVAEFEYDIAEFCDSREAIGCASGSDALLLSLKALNIGPGDEVITSPFTFFATASAISRVGAKPVFVDIDPASFNLDPASVEEAITEKTRAILPVHIFGQCAEMEPLCRIAAYYGLEVIEDACQAIGAEYRGRRAGVLGTMGCFSFFPTKNLGGAGDGGIVTTDDPELASHLRSLRVHGDAGGYLHGEIGINSRLDALQAAVLKVKLAYLDKWSKARRENARNYAELFDHFNLLDVVQLPVEKPDRVHVYNQYSVRIVDGNRDAVLQFLRDKQVGCTIYYPVPLHLQRCFSSLGYAENDLPESECAAQEVLALPIFPELTYEHQEVVVRTIAEALDRLNVFPLRSSRPAAEEIERRAA